MLQFSMHAILIHVNITVGVPTLPTGFDAYAMRNIEEERALVGVNKPLFFNPISLLCVD